jgi:hypothetical protein
MNLKAIFVFLATGFFIQSYLFCQALQPTPEPDYPKIRAAFIGTQYEVFLIKEQCYNECKVTKWEPDGITISHRNGFTKIKIEDLPEDSKKLLGMSLKDAAVYRSDIERRRIAALSVMKKESTEIKLPSTASISSQPIDNSTRRLELENRCRELRLEIDRLYKQQKEANQRKDSSNASAHAKQKELELKNAQAELSALQ